MEKQRYADFWFQIPPIDFNLKAAYCLLNHKSLPGGRLNKKDGLTRYGDSHVKDKTS